MRRCTIIASILVLCCSVAFAVSAEPESIEIIDHEIADPGVFPSRCRIVCLDEGSDGETIFLRRGWFVHVKLLATISTGYYWYLEALNEDVVTSYCETCISVPPVMPGSPCESKWFFQAKGRGVTDMVLKYYRLWEGPESAVNTFTVRFVVY